MKNVVYYLPGYSVQLATGLGAGLLGRGLDVARRETVDVSAVLDRWLD
jgi:hypothetical protein